MAESISSIMAGNGYLSKNDVDATDYGTCKVPIAEYEGRGNGNGTDCEVDPRVWKVAVERTKLLRAAGYEVDLDTCDEWVMVRVYEK